MASNTDNASAAASVRKMLQWLISLQKWCKGLPMKEKNGDICEDFGLNWRECPKAIVKSAIKSGGNLKTINQSINVNGRQRSVLSAQRFNASSFKLQLLY